MPTIRSGSLSTLAVVIFLVKATVILLAAFGITRVMHCRCRFTGMAR